LRLDLVFESQNAYKNHDLILRNIVNSREDVWV